MGPELVAIGERSHHPRLLDREKEGWSPVEGSDYGQTLLHQSWNLWSRWLRSQRGLKRRKLGKLTFTTIFSWLPSLASPLAETNAETRVSWGSLVAGSQFISQTQSRMGKRTGAAASSWQDIGAHSHLPDSTEPQLTWTHTWRCPDPALQTLNGPLLPIILPMAQSSWSDQSTPLLSSNLPHCPSHSWINPSPRTVCEALYELASAASGLTVWLTCVNMGCVLSGLMNTHKHEKQNCFCSKAGLCSWVLTSVPRSTWPSSCSRAALWSHPL